MKPTKALPFFDDRSSLGHAAAGVAMRVLPGPAAAAVGLVFLIYQMQEVEPMGAKLGDFGELAAGYLMAEALE